VLSIVVHLVLGFVFLHPRAPATAPSETVATTQRLRFDRKILPTPQPSRRPIPRPPAPHRLRAEPIVAPAALPVPAPLARVRVRPVPVPAARMPVAPLARAPHARVRHHPLAPPVAVARPTLGDAQIAQITNHLAAAIATDVAQRAQAIAVAPAPLTTPKHYALDASNFTAGDRRSHGLCDPIKNWEQGDYDYYYVACNVRFSDGTFERQSVPWPVRYARTDDPFKGTSGEKPLPAPLPGWQLPAGEMVSPELRAYARERGVIITGG